MNSAFSMIALGRGGSISIQDKTCKVTRKHCWEHGGESKERTFASLDQSTRRQGLVVGHQRSMLVRPLYQSSSGKKPSFEFSSLQVLAMCMNGSSTFVYTRSDQFQSVCVSSWGGARPDMKESQPLVQPKQDFIRADDSPSFVASSHLRRHSTVFEDSRTHR